MYVYLKLSVFDLAGTVKISILKLKLKFLFLLFFLSDADAVTQPRYSDSAASDESNHEV